MLTDRTCISGLPVGCPGSNRSKSRLRLDRHWVARSVSSTWLPGKKRFVAASYTVWVAVCTLV
jgi:hypothetical protein